MKRPCFALTMLLASLAGSLAAVSTANSQSGDEPGSWNADACPLAPSESSGSTGLYDEEYARWLKHQAEERYDESYNYNEASAGESSQGPTPARRPENYVEIKEPATSQPETTPAVEPDYGYRSGYDGDYDYEVYRSEPAPATETTEKLDSYWTENALPPVVSDETDPYWTHQNNEATEELDPYWTEGKLPADVADELDPYWTEGKLPADVSDAVDPYIDPQWAKDAVETVESWLDKLNSRPESEPYGTSKSIPAEESYPDYRAEDVDPIYGPHIWDDCDLGHKLRNCNRPTPDVTDYTEPAPARNESFNVIEHRDLLLSVAHALNEAGEALQTASQSLSRIADEAKPSQPWDYDLYPEEYRD